MASGLYGYNLLFDVLSETSIILLPFFFVIAGQLKDRYEKGGELGNFADFFKGIEAKMMMMVISFGLFVVPAKSFQLDEVKQYTRACEIDGTVRNVESDTNGVEFENVDSSVLPIGGTLINMSGYNIKMPIMMNVVMSVGTGISLQSVKNLPCSLNMMGTSTELLKTQITDPALRKEVNDFVSMCYTPALGLSRKDVNAPWTMDPDTDDLPWPGHEYFMNSSYYGNVNRGFIAKRWVEGYQSSEFNVTSTHFAQDQASCSTNADCLSNNAGFPSCREWWQGLGAGKSATVTTRNEALRTRLAGYLPEVLANDLQSAIAAFADRNLSLVQQANREDYMVQLAFFNPIQLNNIQDAETRDYGYLAEGIGSNTVGLTSRLIGTLGLLSPTDLAVKYATTSVIQKGAPIAKGMIIMLIIVTLPILAIVSKYDVKTLLGVYTLMFSMLMWPYLWEISILAQQSYVDSVYEDNVIGYLDPTEINSRVMISYLTDAMFVGFPLVFSTLLSMAGMSFGKSIGSMGGMNGTGMGSASGGMKKGKQGLKGARNKAAKNNPKTQAVKNAG